MPAPVQRSLVAAMTEIQQNKHGTVHDAYERLFEQDDTGLPECHSCEDDASVPASDAIAKDELPDEHERLLAEVCEPGGECALLQENLPPRRFSSPGYSESVPESVSESVSESDAESSVVPVQVVLSAPQGGELAIPDPAQVAERLRGRAISRPVTLDSNWLALNRVVGFFPETPDMEQYRLLRARVLNAARKKGGNAIMITSALPGEGKTLTAINLAFAFAKGCSENALLVDCDLRRQQICETMGFEGKKGLVDYLLDGCEVYEMLAWPGVERMAVISGGRTVFDSSEMLASLAMKNLVEEMKGRYGDRYVFFDVSSVLSRADALAFAPFVDHVLFVVRAGKTPASEALRALRMLPQDKIIGVVLNEG